MFSLLRLADLEGIIQAGDGNAFLSAELCIFNCRFMYFYFTENIMHDEELTGDSKFNKRQIEEEEIKKDYISKNNNLRDTIYKLEDHHLLQGCLAIFDLTDDIEARAESFINLFKKGCDYDLMSSSLFILGDYTQFYGWIWRMGNKIDSTWRELFTPSQRKTGFEKTKLVIHQLLLHQINNPDFDLMDLVGNYLDSYAKDKDKPKDFWYYYIKYPEFRKNKEGYYHWEDRDNQYECSMMNKKTFGGKNWSPFLYALSKKSKYHIDLGEYGAPLVFVRDNVACKLKNINKGYMLEPYNEDEDSVKLCSTLKKELKLSEGCVYKIDQNEDGIDIKDRVEVGLELISRILSK